MHALSDICYQTQLLLLHVDTYVLSCSILDLFDSCTFFKRLLKLRTVFLWAIQIQLLLQIIINRIRIILLDRKRGRILVIIVAVFITLLNISVFCIWIPARLQISRRYVSYIS